MNCNYKVKITDIQNKYQFKILCKGGANSTNVNDIYNLLPTTTNENTNISISNTADIKAKSITIKGNTTQNGTPTPTIPIDVNVVRGSNEIKIMNINKLPSAELGTYTSSQMTHTCDGKGTYTFNGTANAVSSRYWEIEPYTIQSGDYLYLGNYVAQSGVSFSLYENRTTEIVSLGTSTFINRIASLDSYAGKTITLVRTYSLAQSLTNFAIKPMICNVNTLTDFIEHQEKDFVINFGALELCKIGTYQDYLYKENNKWYKYNAIKKVTWNGSESWTANPGITTTYVIARPTDLAYGNNNVFYNYFSTVADLSVATEGARIGGSINLKNPNTANVSAFKTWLGTNNVTMYYQSTTPTITEITDITLIKQLNNISNNIRTFEGGTNISSTSAGANPIINITTFNKLS